MNSRSSGGKLEEFFNGKGFYIVLFLCAAVIGASAWMLAAGDRAMQSEISVMNRDENERVETVVIPPLEESAPVEVTVPTEALPTPAEETPQSKNIEVGGLRMDCESRRVYVNGKEVYLTAKEFDVLELLVFNPNKVYSRENLLNIEWGYEYPGDVRTVDVHIRRLREKIEENPSDPKYVHTKWGVGYYFQS